MDVEKLIEQLNGYFEGEELRRGAALDAASTLSALQAENKRLRAELKHKTELSHQQANELERRDKLLKEQEDELEQVKREKEEAVYDMTALMAGQCCDLCAVEYCNDRGKTEMCTAFKWQYSKAALEGMKND